MISGARKRAARGRQVREISVKVLDPRGSSHSGNSHWDHAATPVGPDRRNSSRMVVQWERDNRSKLTGMIDDTWTRAKRSWRGLAVVGFAFTLGFSIASGPESMLANLKLRDRLHDASRMLITREGELELTRLELTRLNTVMENSQRYGIPADLAAKIYDIALAEGIDPKVAYG